jgi:hypothetical protein
VQEDWSLSVTGEIVRIDKQDVDKTGRARKFFYEFLLRPESAALREGAPEVGTEILVRIKDLELRRLTRETLEVGDRVIMTVRGSGDHASPSYLTAVEKLPDANQDR